ncbi:hypothetical protein [Paenibacillus koleovorans]|uniref:hypothetical protein n=1 Tax=Paenibacillus koleovorans TaxID=121608 RepID=UPI000FD7D813|nr:hypothetical protein [Paenibacillus koleovorans]
MQSAYSGLPSNNEQRLARILSPDHPLCKEDVVWVLEFIKKKVADGDPRLLDLAQPRLLQNFQHFADASLMLLQRRPCCGQEADRFRISLREAAYGLYTPGSSGRMPRS